MWCVNITSTTTQRDNEMNNMTITLDTKKAGEQAVFTIKFKSEDFMNVVDMIDTVTIGNVFNQELFTVA